MKATFIFVIFIITFCIFQSVSANSSNIVISEILPDGVGADSGKEYLELYNSGSVITLDNWYIVNTSSSGSSKKIVLPLINLTPYTYFVIAEDLSLLNISHGISIGAGKLAFYNDFGKVELFNTSDVKVAEFNYGDSKEGNSWELSSDCTFTIFSVQNTPGSKNSNDNNCTQTSVPTSFPQDLKVEKIEFSLDKNVWTDTISTTINKEVFINVLLNESVQTNNLILKDDNGNLLSKPLYFNKEYKGRIHAEINLGDRVLKSSSMSIEILNNISNKVIISEVYPSPETPDKEWIEIYNGDNFAINLANYYIEEKTAIGITNTRRALKNITVPPKEYYVLFEDEFNISLNNSGDTLYLFDINSNQINIFTYSEAEKSKSYGRKLNDGIFSSEISETLTPTPNQENKFAVTINSLVQYSLKDISLLDSGAEVLISVYVNNTVDKYIFLQDGSYYLKAKLTTQLQESLFNVLINTKAKVVLNSGIKTLLIDPDEISIIEYIEPNYEFITSENINILEIGRQYIITGKVKEIYSNRLRLDINGSLISIYTKQPNELASFLKNKEITIWGTADYYRNTFRIIEISHTLPEVISDSAQVPISYVEKTTLISQPYKEENSYLYLVTFGYIAFSIIFFIEIIKNRKIILKAIRSKMKSIGKLKHMIKY